MSTDGYCSIQHGIFRSTATKHQDYILSKAASQREKGLRDNSCLSPARYASDGSRWRITRCRAPKTLWRATRSGVRDWRCLKFTVTSNDVTESLSRRAPSISTGNSPARFLQTHAYYTRGQMQSSPENAGGSRTDDSGASLRPGRDDVRSTTISRVSNLGWITSSRP